MMTMQRNASDILRIPYKRHKGGGGTDILGESNEGGGYGKLGMSLRVPR